MKRNHSAHRASFLLAAASILAPPPVFAPSLPPFQIQSPTRNSSAKFVPYGAVQLEDTNLNAFKTSILDQLHENGFPGPRGFNPFPETPKSADDSNQVEYDSFQDTLTGELPDANSLKIVVGDLNLAFRGWAPGFSPHSALHLSSMADSHADRNPPPCENLVLKEKFARPVRVFDSLHEIMHYILEEMLERKVAAVVRLYKRAGQKKDYQYALEEKLADGGAALYILQDYSDTGSSRHFLHQWQNLRNADYVRTLSDTASTISAAEKFSALRPHDRLTVIDAALQIVDIAYRHELEKPDVNRLYAKIEMLEKLLPLANNFSPSYGKRLKSAVRDMQSALLIDASGLSSPDRVQVQQQVRDIMDARNSACGIPAP